MKPGMNKAMDAQAKENAHAQCAGMHVYQFPAHVIRNWSRAIHPTMALISIQEEFGPCDPLSQWTCPKLLLQFSDILEARPAGDRTKPIQPVHADAIVAFVERHRPPLLLVHCRMGVSRSAAVSLAMHLLYGAVLSPDFWERCAPNPAVLRALIAAWERRHGRAHPALAAGPGHCPECPNKSGELMPCCTPQQLECGEMTTPGLPRLCPALLPARQHLGEPGADHERGCVPANACRSGWFEADE